MTKSELEILQPLATKTFYPLMIGAEEGREGGGGDGGGIPADTINDVVGQRTS